MISMLLQCAVLIFFFMCGAFVVAHIKKDNSVADIAWGIGFILVALFSLFKNNLFLPRQLLVTSLIVVWGIRLSGHLFMRSIGKGEDVRYAQWRKVWGSRALLMSFLLVFMLQGLMMFIISYPVVLINSKATPTLGLFDYFVVAFFLVGFLFEAIGDFQLQQFLKKPENKGRIMRYGLWKYTRHPNYFGEIVMWWSIFLLGACVPFGWSGIISPLLLTYLLISVSGIPLNERQFAGNPEFEEYKKRTNMLIPWFEKKV